MRVCFRLLMSCHSTTLLCLASMLARSCLPTPSSSSAPFDEMKREYMMIATPNIQDQAPSGTDQSSYAMNSRHKAQHTSCPRLPVICDPIGVARGEHRPVYGIRPYTHGVSRFTVYGYARTVVVIVRHANGTFRGRIRPLTGS